MYIPESQYNSIENNFGIDIFECWGFRPISYLRHLFLKNKLKFKLYERKFIIISTVDLQKVLDDHTIILEQNFDQMITFPSVCKIGIK